MRGFGSECCKAGLKSNYIEYWDGEEFGTDKGHWVIIGSNSNCDGDSNIDEQIFYCPFCGIKLGET